MFTVWHRGNGAVSGRCLNGPSAREIPMKNWDHGKGGAVRSAGSEEVEIVTLFDPGACALLRE